MAKLTCTRCEQELDKVVLGFGTRTWDPYAQKYTHREDDDEGDWACPRCGSTQLEERLKMTYIVYFEDGSSKSMFGTHREVREAFPNAIKIDEA